MCKINLQMVPSVSLSDHFYQLHGSAIATRSREAPSTINVYQWGQ